MEHPVVDLSHWNVANEEIPFAAIKADGVIGVIHKVTQGSQTISTLRSTNAARSMPHAASAQRLSACCGVRIIFSNPAACASRPSGSCSTWARVRTCSPQITKTPPSRSMS